MARADGDDRLMLGEIAIKRGEALILAITITSNGAALDVTNAVLSAEVRDPEDNLVGALPLVKQPTVGLVSVQVADTSQWPPGRLRCDLRIVSNGLPIYSDTFPIRVNRAVTQS